MLQFDTTTLLGISDPEDGANTTIEKLGLYRQLIEDEDPALHTRNSATGIAAYHGIIDWFFSKIRALKNDTKPLCISTMSASANGIRTRNSIDSFLNINARGITPHYPEHIRICLVKTGLDIYEAINTEYADSERFQGIETVMTTSRYHKLRIFKDSHGTVVYLTNRWEREHLFKLVGLLPAFYPNLLTEDTKEEYEPLFEAFYNLDVAPIEKAFLKDFTIFEQNRKKRALQKLKTIWARANEKQIQTLEKSVELYKSQQDQYQKSIEDIENNIRQRQLTIMALKLTPDEKDDGTVTFLQKTNAVDLLVCNDQYAEWIFRTPIVNYILKDVEMYFKRDDANMLNNPAWLGSLIRETFIEQKYQMLTETKIRTSWDSSDYRASAIGPQVFGNPHLVYYNCFSSSRYEAHSAMQNGETLQALHILLAACATITFTDSSVVTRLAEDIKFNKFEGKFLKNMETGELLSPAEYKARYEALNTLDETIV